MTKSIAAMLLDQLLASSMIVSVVRPRKSILRRPSFSMPPMSYCVTTSSLFVLYSGTSSFSGVGRDHDAGRMDRRVARHSFQLAGDVEHLADARIALTHLLKAGLLRECVLQLDVELIRDQLRDSVDFADLHVEHAADVLDRRARAERAERDDLRDLLAAVLLGDVLNDLAAAMRAEVDVDIGHADALRIEEALEQQAVLQRIDVGDLHRIADQTAGRRSAPGTHGNIDAISRYRMKSQTTGSSRRTSSAECILISRSRRSTYSFEIAFQRACARHSFQPRTAPLKALSRDVLEIRVDGVLGREHRTSGTDL